ncbi:hypothetical protein ACFFGR_06570 [Arthrobacter liuii]|uniref:hypothetical protein n=1 Tax=Arthrobacter liuii TaxID=1476996 RepID=UPI0035E4ACF6
MSERLDLYHRTTEEAARTIVETGRFLTRENTREAFVSTHVDGQAVGYGDAVVHVRVDEADAQLDDEFPDGEQHYRIPLDRAEIVEAFTVNAEGERTPLAGTVTTTRAASFPSQPQARTATAITARPATPAAGKSGPELSR